MGKSKSVELVVGIVWQLGLNFLRLLEGLDGLSMCVCCLHTIYLHSQPLLGLPDKMHIPGGLGVDPLERLMYL